MNKKFIYILIGLVVCFASFTFFYTYPKEINKSFNGILFQLGSENSDFEETVQIKVNGKIKQELFGNRYFIGTITINDQVLPPSDAREQQVKFIIGDYNGALIQYIRKDSILAYGKIFIKNDFDALTIAIYEDDGWDSEDGKILSAPATNREEALKIANELFFPIAKPFK